MSVFIPVPKKDNAKECSDYRTTALILRASKVMLKILQPTFQQYTNQELADVPGLFRKGRGNRDQIVNICCIIEKAREKASRKASRKPFTSASLAILKLLTVLITTNWKVVKEMEKPDHFICLKKQKVESDMEKWTGSKLGKESIKAVYCHPIYLIYMQSTS